MKKKGFTLVEIIAVIIIIAIIAILAIPSVLNAIQESKGQVSEAMKSVLVSASEVYMSDNKNDYVRYNGNRYCITLRQLIEADKLTNPIMDPMNGQEISQDKFVQVDISNNEYSYEIVDSCEEIHNEVPTIAGKLLEQYDDSNTVGLLKDDTGYYYKGTNEEVGNNFVWFAGHLWRVISIDNDKNLTMITQQPVTSIQPASAAWATPEAYESSYINHWLNTVFLDSIETSDKTKLLEITYNVGIYDDVSEITTTQKVGLLDETQYSKAGGANSFLDIKDYWGLGNRYNDSDVSYINNNGILSSKVPSSDYGVRAVVKTSNLTVTIGEGTLDDSFRDSSATTNTSDIKVGEYISLPTTSAAYCGTDKRCLFRVVSKDSNSIKITLNGLLPSTSAITIPYTSGSSIDKIVTTFANTINENYRYSGADKTFGIGTYSVYSTNYTAVQKTKYAGNVGLPVVGEMFTANDIDMTTNSTAKTFVNINTIENPTVSTFYWTMNAYTTSLARFITHVGGVGSDNRAVAYGIRPVLFLNQGLTFTGGDGTAENPFMLGE